MSSINWTAQNGVRNRKVNVHPFPVSELDLSGQHLAVIGGTNGLGQAIAHQALQVGAKVTVVGRTFRGGTSADLQFIKADLSLMSESLVLADELPAESIDVLLFTNGIFAAKTREETSEGIERDMAVSYLSRFAILQRIAPRLGTTRSDHSIAPRVFVMAAPGAGILGDPADLNAEAGYSGFKAHINTVAANEALVVAGAAGEYPGLSFFGLNPGLVKTGIRSNFLGDGSLTHRLAEAAIGILQQSPEQYAARILPLLFAPDLNKYNGIMFNNKAKPILASQGMNLAYAKQFIASSQSLLSHALR
ncbi:short-chain dehydrogenase [Mycobacteroides abscessus subsp. bolletii]|nr:short-chain dehydrogenase [Mycobacteroides abscessus subsp. bolletii]SHZ94005.1 short-chain dehydrogenase [Mycobacteroides abscessus subsp. bolletii]SII53917.1 short-chain dehydrogenase [Mycobacteroides abscessus subsp. bolletii]SLD44161.1 short-chain dehydrogenase [Mycobacteroides abscessus subsp. bolletii]SLD73316.1 short-chain dehydrogenase [Mycobacteroides abscessus subsp. bolletii]